MKKIYFFAAAFVGGLALAPTASAQVSTQRVPDAISKQEVKQAILEGEQDKAYVAKAGDELFTEDFSNGFEGNNTYGAWTATDNNGNDIWHWVENATGEAEGVDGETAVYQADFPTAFLPAGVGIGDPVVSPAGQFSNFAQGTFASTTVANGWVIFDADLFNSPVANTVDVSGYLTSPVIDMSDMTSVVIEYQQFFRYCCFGASPLTLEVTNDGENWSAFEAAGTFVQSANVASANPLTTQVDVSCAAAGQEEVQFRFGYNGDQATGYSHYFWALDDVRIFEVPFENNLEVREVNNGDIFAAYEYAITPEGQVPADGVLAGVVYKNGGFANQDEVSITIDITDVNDVVLASVTSEVFQTVSYTNSPICPQDDFDTLLISTGFIPADYNFTQFNLTATISNGAIVDETPEDNTLSKPIFFTPDEFGHDNALAFDEEQRPREDTDNPGVNDPVGYGNIFEFEVTDDVVAWGTHSIFGQNSDEGTIFFSRLLEIGQNADGDFDINGEGETLTEAEYTFDADWASASLTDFVGTYLPFDDTYDEFETDGRYFACVIAEDDQEGELTIVANSNSDTDFSSAEFERAGDDSFIWFLSDTSTPAVRLILSDRVAVDEVAKLNDFSVGQNVPNPATDNTFIPYNLKQAMDVSFTFSDITGKTVKTVNLGMVPAGQYKLDINANEFATGIYTFTMTAGEVNITKKMIIE